MQKLLYKLIGWFRQLRFIRIRVQTLHVFVSAEGTDWFVAYDEMDAMAAARESYEAPDYENISAFHLVPDHSIFTMVDTDADSYKELFFPIFGKWQLKSKRDFWEISVHEYYEITAPAWCWAFSNGRGFLCSTDY